ncbi:hypothetical protein HK097_008425 [Rhizophlyctis rosea]|uniref:Superoxide dismutase copper/zinc binding domain-containing protein n=1 Tax=Rhizophlyctis rosea TaxID=64517 RepID=A0AAD5X3Y0_9FUNG|nr:hypothetical protein HK097_008425 [Rhizophlyctis rosea]
MQTKFLIALTLAGAASVHAQNTTLGVNSTAVALVHNGTYHFNVTFVQKEKGTQIWVANHLPETGGPFQFHIHNALVSNNNCSSTGGHLNPYNVSIAQSTKGNLSSYEIGDLSGKWGNVTSHKPDPTHQNSTDPHSLTKSTLAQRDPSFNVSNIIGLSVVVHNSTGARVACANIFPSNATGHPVEEIGEGLPVAFPAVAAVVENEDVGRHATIGAHDDEGEHDEDEHHENDGHGHSGAGVVGVSKVVYGVAGLVALVAASL